MQGRCLFRVVRGTRPTLRQGRCLSPRHRGGRYPAEGLRRRPRRGRRGILLRRRSCETSSRAGPAAARAAARPNGGGSWPLTWPRAPLMSPREIAPRQIAPRQIAPRQIAPRQIAPRQIAPREPREIGREIGRGRASSRELREIGREIGEIGREIWPEIGGLPSSSHGPRSSAIARGRPRPASRRRGAPWQVWG